MSVLSVRQVLLSDFRLREPKWLQSGGKLDHVIRQMIGRAHNVASSAKLLQGEGSDLDYTFIKVAVHMTPQLRNVWQWEKKW